MKALVFILVFTLACSAPPADSGVDGGGGSSEGDAGTDGGSNVGPAIREGDMLVPDSSGRVVFAPGLAACLTPSLLHADGTSEAIGDALITTSNGAVALGGTTADCRFSAGRYGIGLIAGAPGATSATVRYEHNGKSVQGTMPVVVAADVTILSLGLRYVPIVPTGSRGPYPEQTYMQIGDFVLSDWSKIDCDCDIAWRYVTLATGDAQIATVQRLSSRRWLISGRSKGQTTLGGELAPPGQAKLALTAAPLNVPGAGTLSGASGVQLVDAAGDPVQGAQPGTCYQAQLLGVYTEGGLAWNAPISSGVSWQSRTAAATIDASGRVCTAHGDMVLVGCAGTSCSSLAQPVWAMGEVGALTITQTATGPVKPAGASWTPYIVVCPHVRVDAALSDGGVLPLTQSPNATWNTQSDAGVAWPRVVNAEGTTLQDPSGNPCLRTNAPSGGWPAQPFDVTVGVSYGGSPPANFTMTVTPPY